MVGSGGKDKMPSFTHRACIDRKDYPVNSLRSPSTLEDGSSTIRVFAPFAVIPFFQGTPFSFLLNYYTLPYHIDFVKIENLSSLC